MFNFESLVIQELIKFSCMTAITENIKDKIGINQFTLIISAENVKYISVPTNSSNNKTITTVST